MQDDFYAQERAAMAKTVKKGVAWTVIGILILLFLTAFRPWTIIRPGTVGVVVNFGAVQEEIMTEGLHFRVPVYQKIVRMDCRVQKTQVETSAASKDLQTVDSHIVVNFYVNKATAAKLYQTVGMDYSNKVVTPAIQESIKAITANYTAEQLITRRDEVSDKTKDLLGQKLQTYGIIIDKFNIINFEFSKTFSDAVEAKQEAEQRALKANYDLQRIKVEAAQKVENAKAEAQALALQKQQVTPELVQLRQIEVNKAAIEKWDGHLPTYSGGGAIPFINVK